MPAGKPQIDNIDERGEHRRRRRDRHDQHVDQARSCRAAAGVRAPACAWRARRRRAVRPGSFPGRCRNRNCDRTTSAPMSAAHSTSRPTGYHSSVGPAPFGDRPRKQREIAEPPAPAARCRQERDEEIARRARAPSASRAGQRRRPARPNGSSRARRSGSAAARDRTAASPAIEPDATDANSSAAAAPAPSPTRTICIIASCPASSAVRDGSGPPQPSVAGDCERLDASRRPR